MMSMHEKRSLPCNMNIQLPTRLHFPRVQHISSGIAMHSSNSQIPLGKCYSNGNRVNVLVEWSRCGNYDSYHRLS